MKNYTLVTNNLLKDYNLTKESIYTMASTKKPYLKKIVKENNLKCFDYYLCDDYLNDRREALSIFTFYEKITEYDLTDSQIAKYISFHTGITYEGAHRSLQFLYGKQKAFVGTKLLIGLKKLLATLQRGENTEIDRMVARRFKNKSTLAVIKDAKY